MKIELHSYPPGTRTDYRLQQLFKVRSWPGAGWQQDSKTSRYSNADGNGNTLGQQDSNRKDDDCEDSGNKINSKVATEGILKAIDSVMIYHSTALALSTYCFRGLAGWRVDIAGGSIKFATPLCYKTLLCYAV